jgi:molybdate transport system substrate-binding protein
MFAEPMYRHASWEIAKMFIAFKNVTAIVLLLLPAYLVADTIRVAVASNFTLTMQEIAQQFEQRSGHNIELIPGSTGKIYAQILNGAPFDAFFAADSLRPELLEQAGRTLPDSRFSYAIGQLVLWSPDPELVDDQGKVLQGDHFHHLAIANPKLAPYGKAAQQVLQNRHVWEKWQKKIVRGENIGQAFQFVQSRNAELGFVALSQLKTSSAANTGSHWLVPVDLYDPVEQQAVQLTDKQAATALMNFIKSDSARDIIQHHGYLLP